MLRRVTSCRSYNKSAADTWWSIGSCFKRESYDIIKNYKQNKEFENALYCFDLLEMSLPYDFDQGIKRNNITKEKLIFDKFEMYKYAANKEKTKALVIKVHSDR